MKQWIVMAAAGFCLFACKKEVTTPTESVNSSNRSIFQTTKRELRDSLSSDDFRSLDISRWYKSKDAQSDGYFIRIAFQDKALASDFVLLKADSLGHIRQGRIIHVDKTTDNEGMKNASFNGWFTINSLDRKKSVTKEVVNGKWKRTININSFMEEPAGEQELPDVVVTSYSPNGSYTGNWYLYNGFYDEWSNGNSGRYTYGSAGGGGSTSNSDENTDNTMVIEVESNEEPPIKVDDYLKCFSSIPDANATYQLTIYADIPVNGDPSKNFNWTTTSPGHSFIQLRKSSGTLVVQQNIGFYPQTSWKSLSKESVASKVVDNQGHEFNASLTQTVSASQFQAAISRMESLETVKYDITSWNCTDFALSVFNTATYKPMAIPQYVIPGNELYSNTPQGLYTEIKMLQASGNTSHGTPDIPGIAGYVGNSHGSCGE